MILLHNNECSKSNAALRLLNEAQANFSVRDYIKEPLNEQEIAQLLHLLKMDALDIIRKKEPFFMEHFADKMFSNDQWISVLIKHPQLLERPILVGEDFALIGRPPEVIDEYLKSL